MQLGAFINGQLQITKYKVLFFAVEKQVMSDFF